jgi:ribosomal protein L12E/L44/L45/RPP1/RPP2
LLRKGLMLPLVHPLAEALSVARTEANSVIVARLEMEDMDEALARIATTATAQAATQAKTEIIGR